MTTELVPLRKHANGPATTPNPSGLAAELRRLLEGEVRFDDGSRALYATDASNYRHVPIGVVVPRHRQDVIRAVEVCRRFDVPVLPRGGGTSLAGQCCNVAVVLDFTKYVKRILEVDLERKRVRVEPGIVLDEVRKKVEQHGLTIGPDPSTHTHCTLGGMIGNNSCGTHAVQAEFYGPGPRTEDCIQELEVLTYDGTVLRLGPTSDDEFQSTVASGGRPAEILTKLKRISEQYAEEIRTRFPRIPRRVSGFNLPALLPEGGFDLAKAMVGTEATCAITLEAVIELIPHLPHRVMVVVGYPSVYEAAAHVQLARKCAPVGCEGIDDRLLGYLRDKGEQAGGLKLLPPGKGWLITEFGADTQEEAQRQAASFGQKVRSHPAESEQAPEAKVVTDPHEQEKIWQVRKSGLGATAFVPGKTDTWPGWEDAAVPPEHVAAYLKEFRALLDEYGYRGSLYGHFAQGCIHVRIDFDLASEEGIHRYRQFSRRATELVLSYGGSLSGEHGDGQARGDLLELMYGPKLMDAFRAFKQAWDPDGRMNPGKVIDARPRTTDLRLGADFVPRELDSHFRFRQDEGQFARAAMRCVGVGTCRRHEGGTMCPSFRATHEEKHTTRGRAHLLFELLNKDLSAATGWQNEAVKESLDLCLACKGCKSDCPVNVDIATYKAEFLSHYYTKRLRPPSAFAFGLIYRWARIASLAPKLVNRVSRSPLKRLLKRGAGVAQKRELPQFAPNTFRAWAKRRTTPAQTLPKAVLWPDTFNNHFHPGTLVATLRVMEHVGFAVIVPQQALCCGRPLYDFGMLDTAKKLWREILDALEPHLDGERPVVCVEPSCAAAFRDELPNLMNDPRADKLAAQIMTLSELLEKHAPEHALPEVDKAAILHRHCHHKSVLGTKADEQLLQRLAVRAHQPESGCCGMAGAFGFEREKYDVSIALAETALAPAVRGRQRDTLVIADGFSCREQVRQSTDLLPVHSAELVWQAIRSQQEPAVLTTDQIYEDCARLATRDASPPPRSAARAALLAEWAAGVTVLLVLVLWLVS